MKITNVYGKNQKSKKIIKDLEAFLKVRPNTDFLKISNHDYEELIKTFPVKDQETQRKFGLKLNGVLIVPIFYKSDF